MDEIDKRLLFELDENCRITYRELADRIGISPNAIKKRITNLIESGVIHEFVVQLRNRMADATLVISAITTDGAEDRSVFYEAINEHPATLGVFPQIEKSYILYSQCIGLQQVNDLSIHLRGIDHVSELEMHIIGEQPLPDGRTSDLTKMQLRVLKTLIDDPRKQIVEICQESGLSARRVRKTLEEIHENDSIHFAVFWNVNMGEGLYFMARVEFDARSTNSKTLEAELKEHLPVEYWYSYVSATEPVMFSVFVVKHTRDMQDVATKVKNMHGVISVRNMVLYPVQIFKFPLREALKTIIDAELT
ncbi:MAG: Lrp/AsnC family transcriptional regulator [Candidatus Thorarchaeota archaeon]